MHGVSQGMPTAGAYGHDQIVRIDSGVLIELFVHLGCDLDSDLGLLKGRQLWSLERLTGSIL